MDIGITELKGKTLASVEVPDDKSEMSFVTTEGEQFKMYHSQDCCESVSIEDIVGDLSDLIGEPILQAEEATNRDDPPPDRTYVDSFTWTFYKLATIKGSVTIRWLGESNGYYSESVDFYKVA